MRKTSPMQKGWVRQRKPTPDNSSYTPSRYGKTYRSSRRNTILHKPRTRNKWTGDVHWEQNGIWGETYYDDRHFSIRRSQVQESI